MIEFPLSPTPFRAPRTLRLRLLFIGLLCVSGFLFPVAGQVVQIDGDRITIRARNNTLKEVLAAVAAEGVKVRVDPAVEADVHGDLIDTPIDDALEMMLADFGYSIRFKAIKGPVGDISRVSEVNVFRNGFAGKARLLKSKSGVFDIIRDPHTGQEYIRDEILVAITQPMEKADFLNIIQSVGGRVVDGLPGTKVYRVKLTPNSSIPGVIAHLAKNYPALKAEPNLAIREPGPEGQAPDAAGAGTPGASEFAGPTDGAGADPANGGAGSTGEAGAPGDPTPPPVSAGTPAIAVLDSGLSPDLKLGDLLQGSFDATNPTKAISDARGHGTQMALIASGTIAPNGSELTGEGTPLLAIRSFDENGATSNFAMMRAIEYAANEGASVMSLSWGSESASEFMAGAVRAAQDSGMVVIAAAGNDPNGNTTYPAAYDNVIGVGALSPTGERWEKSNFGAHVDVVAPGQANFPVGHNGPPGVYNGTSISTPYVANAFSLYRAQHPDASEEQMLRDFNASLRDAGKPGRDDLYGNGVFDDAARTRFLAGQR